MAAIVVIALLLAGTWFVARATAPRSTDAAVASHVSEEHSGKSGEKTAPRPYDTSLVGEDPAEANVRTTTGSQLSYVRLSDGVRMGTANERFARPALSIIKLYIADYVLREGSVEDSYKALDMIANSSDKAADKLFEKYPDSITETARHYNLYSTTAGPTWGESLTSTYDMTEFLAALMKEDEVHPILVAMSNADKVAEDGYDQDFGTAKLDGVIGTKWGWSNDKDLHNSVSFGKDFIVAAGVSGSADDLSKLVEKQVTKGHLKEAEKRARGGSHEMVPPLPTVTSSETTSSESKSSESKSLESKSSESKSLETTSKDDKKDKNSEPSDSKKKEEPKDTESKSAEPKSKK